MTFAEFTQTHAWKNAMSKLYGLGAAVVIFGALFKIMHWPGAGAFLTIGLTVEALIFAVSAFEPLHDELDWTLVYPELAGLDHGSEENIGHDAKAVKPRKQVEIAATTVANPEALVKFNEMLEKAGQNNLFEKFGEGIADLNKKVGQLANITDVASASNEFAGNLKNAAASVGKISSSSETLSNAMGQSSESLSYSVEGLSDAYNKSAQLVQQAGQSYTEAYKKLTSSMDVDFSAIKSGNAEYGQKLGNLNKNLAALNAIFELQLNESDVDKMVKDIQGSVQESRKFNEKIQQFGQTLDALNTVYGNILGAMNYKK